MARKLSWTEKHYKAVILGNHGSDILGLREIYTGFDAKDGYNLKNFSQWTSSQKRKVRELFKRANHLQAQAKTPRKIRGKALREAQKAHHGNIPSKNMKVAFVPSIQPQLEIIKTSSDWHEEYFGWGMYQDYPNYRRWQVYFNQKALAVDAYAEIKRCADLIPKCILYFIKMGEFQSVAVKSTGIKELARMVNIYIHRYDGKKPLPASSGNRGDNPKNHKWNQWLEGLIGYEVMENIDFKILAKRIEKGRKKAQDNKKERDNYMRRTARRKRGKNDLLHQ